MIPMVFIARAVASSLDPWGSLAAEGTTTAQSDPTTTLPTRD
jgi:hypothetical protein